MRYLAIIFIFFISGCTIKTQLQQDSVTNKYMIAYPTLKAPNHQSYSESIKVSLPVAPQFLYTSNITYTLGDGNYGSYLYNFWGETPAKQFQFILANILRLSGHFASVIISPTQIDNALTLESRIEKFDYFLKDDVSKVRLHVNLFLVNADTKSVVKSRYFLIEQKVKNKSPKGIVEGFSKAMQILGEDILLWLNDDKQQTD